MYLLQNTDMPIRYTRNALFFGLPNFALGFVLRKINFHKKSWYKYLYLILGILFYLLQLIEYNLVKTENTSLEMYISSVLSAIFLLQFFLGIKNSNCPFYYKWIGKNGPFYIYILHMAVAVILSKIVIFNSVNFKSFVVLLFSFLIYEITYLLYMLLKKKLYIVEK